MQIDLTPDVEKALSEHAAMHGTTPEILILDTLKEVLALASNKNEVSASNLADYLSDHIGVIASTSVKEGEARLSESTKGMFAKGLVEKRRLGKL